MRMHKTSAKIAAFVVVIALSAGFVVFNSGDDKCCRDDEPLDVAFATDRPTGALTDLDNDTIGVRKLWNDLHFHVSFIEAKTAVGEGIRRVDVVDSAGKTIQTIEAASQQEGIPLSTGVVDVMVGVSILFVPVRSSWRSDTHAVFLWDASLSRFKPLLPPRSISNKANSPAKRTNWMYEHIGIEIVGAKIDGAKFVTSLLTNIVVEDNGALFSDVFPTCCWTKDGQDEMLRQASYRIDSRAGTIKPLVIADYASASWPDDPDMRLTEFRERGDGRIRSHTFSIHSEQLNGQPSSTGDLAKALELVRRTQMLRTGAGMQCR